ncbi:uncharacterized protein LOC129894591 [Solanum dulcamara]|uniref:uncharacterized protein LOC129894591 n=1 Tax=Solanum dulcamara TaxID=45834 RepID=UPI00248555AC|nr:uncharacterized protein LOC129894591 [Solanum dulcamara]
MVTKIDHDHPLFLSPSDVPGAVKIGIQLVGMENYTLWRRAMQLNLLTKNKLGFIDGSINRDDFKDNVEKKQWDLCNAIKCSTGMDPWDEFDSIVPPLSYDCAKSKEYTDSIVRQKLLQFLM